MNIVVSAPNGQIVADGELGQSVFEIEGNYYFDRNAVSMENFQMHGQGQQYTCPVKRGTCDYYDLMDPATSKPEITEVGWIYEHVDNEQFKVVEGKMAFYKNKGLSIMELEEA